MSLWKCRVVVNLSVLEKAEKFFGQLSTRIRSLENSVSRLQTFLNFSRLVLGPKSLALQSSILLYYQSDLRALKFEQYVLMLCDGEVA